MNVHTRLAMMWSCRKDTSSCVRRVSVQPNSTRRMLTPWQRKGGRLLRCQSSLLRDWRPRPVAHGITRGLCSSRISPRANVRSSHSSRGSRVVSPHTSARSYAKELARATGGRICATCVLFLFLRSWILFSHPYFPVQSWRGRSLKLW